MHFSAANLDNSFIFIALQDFKTSGFGLSRLSWGLDEIVLKASASVSEDFVLVVDYCAL
jgi:hypothetical protein